MDISAFLVGQLITQQFPQWAGLPIWPVDPGGWDNRTFRLGEHMSVRLPSAEGYAPQVEKEHRWLPHLALHLPVPLALGAPGCGYPWPWSVYAWLDGESALTGYIHDLAALASSLGEFLAALQRVGAADGPPPGPHSAFRGGRLNTYDAETRQALTELHGETDTRGALALWKALIMLAEHHGTDPARAAESRRVLAQVLADQEEA